MKFEEAERRARAVANGGYSSISYEKTTYASGREQTTCKIYLGENFHIGNTWEEAFKALEMSLSFIPDPVEEAPEVEA